MLTNPLRCSKGCERQNLAKSASLQHGRHEAKESVGDHNKTTSFMHSSLFFMHSSLFPSECLGKGFVNYNRVSKMLKWSQNDSPILQTDKACGRISGSCKGKERTLSHSTKPLKYW
eukprot:6325691-Amphidinium_carterae.1